MRHEASQSIRQALQKIFMNHNPDEVWSRIKDSPLSEDARSVYPTYCVLYFIHYGEFCLCRNDVLSGVAQELEFSAHSMSTTTDGYEERTKSKVDTIRMLKKPEG